MKSYSAYFIRTEDFALAQNSTVQYSVSKITIKNP
jgi:hypothetical protein